MSQYRLSQADELPHAPTADSNFNESVYVNGIDPQTGLAVWMRLGNRVNEGYAELQTCIYLPDGRIACQFQRPTISSNNAFEAGGMRYSVDEPFARVAMAYDGELMLVEDPDLFRDPKRLFTEAPRIEAGITMHLEQVSDIHGGEPVNDEQPTMYGRDFSFGHFYQHMRSVAELLRWRYDIQARRPRLARPLLGAALLDEYSLLPLVNRQFFRRTRVYRLKNHFARWHYAALRQRQYRRHTRGHHRC